MFLVEFIGLTFVYLVLFLSVRKYRDEVEKSVSTCVQSVVHSVLSDAKTAYLVSSICSLMRPVNKGGASVERDTKKYTILFKNKGIEYTLYIPFQRKFQAKTFTHEKDGVVVEFNHPAGIEFACQSLFENLNEL